MDSGNSLEKLGPVTYSVDIGNGTTVKRHIDQLRQKADPSPKSTSQPTDDYFYQYEPDTPTPDADPIPPIPRQENQEPVEPRYPHRRHRPPDRFIHEEF